MTSFSLTITFDADRTTVSMLRGILETIGLDVDYWVWDSIEDSSERDAKEVAEILEALAPLDIPDLRVIVKVME